MNIKISLFFQFLYYFFLARKFGSSFLFPVSYGTEQTLRVNLFLHFLGVRS